ncbi:MAG: hypothetical protein L7F77_03560 [Candidatus Magnetominusculus sp. LBB02]|nr:hypothetical protein [Candidatus Magnetominusculus sp. LBB02]
MALLSYGIFLYLNDAFTGFKSGIIDLIMTNIKSEGAFAKLSAGYNDIFHSITDILISSIFQIFALYVFMTLANKIEKYSDSNKQSGIRRIVLTIVVLVYTAVIGQLLLITIASIQFKFIAIIFIGSIIAYFYRFIKSESYDKRYLMLLTVCLIPFILTGRIILDYTPIHYGFYLLPLGLVCYYMFYFNSFPAIYAKLLKTGETRHRYYYISAAILLVLLSLPYCYINHISFKLRDLKLNTNLGQFIFYDNEMLNHVIGLVQYLQKNTPRQSTLVVFPEGVSINLLANRNNPLKYFTFLPPEFKSIGESTIISSLIKEKIDYIAVVNLSTEEYGYTNFQSYATQLYKSIVENYTLDTVIAAPLHTKNNVNIVSSDFHDVEMLDKALRENYKLDECTITLFKHR